MAMDAQRTSNNQPSNAFTRITNALSDLFCVGEPIPKSSSPSSFPGARKISRKQPNPMHYVVSKSSDSEINTYSPGGDQIGTMKNVSVSSVDNIKSGLGLLKELTVDDDDQVKLVDNFHSTQEEEDADSLDGFSRTEVTVIDTSFACWKFEKFLFRKNVTWKVRDKKGNRATVALGKKKKKRKALVMATEKNEGKKLKVLHQGSSMLKTGSSGCNEMLGSSVAVAEGGTSSLWFVGVILVEDSDMKLWDFESLNLKLTSFGTVECRKRVGEKRPVAGGKTRNDVLNTGIGRGGPSGITNAFPKIFL